ncbi:hypothetical protein [Chitinophaga sp. XS-30]|uniref:hypothetical protein n=1 Tax=Chitinophaga sp. XS-30 TaxID=2604421 RepID=UPI0011DDEEF4|nr:hypothetical protein [Chitinophaga sp. XS-30]QEH39727.1 hypothetical protein FW415_02150 [Chitinophaga sp. XS-30]
MVGKRTVYLMLAVIIAATLLAAYGLLGKGKAAPAVHMIMYGNTFSYEAQADFNNESFWDNYPYWVLLSRNKSVQPGFLLKTGNGATATFKDILTSGDSLFFRYQREGLNDSTLNTILKIIVQSNATVSIITDRSAIRQLEKFDGFAKLKEHIYTTEVMLPLRIDHSGLPYFFRIDGYFKVQDILVPREAVPEVILKYLHLISPS